MLTHATKRWPLKQHVAHNALAHLLPEQILGLADTLVAQWRQMVQPHSFRCSLACSWGPGRPVSLPGCGQSWKSVVEIHLLVKSGRNWKTGSTLSAMSIVGEPSILLLRHIQTSPLTPHALNSSAAKKVLFIFHHWFCYHATLSQSGSDLKQLTLICSRKTNFFSQFPTFWLTSRSSSSWRQVWGGSGSSAGSLPLHISTDGHGGHTAEPIEHRHALSSLQLWLDDLTPTAGAVVVVILCAEWMNTDNAWQQWYRD